MAPFITSGYSAFKSALNMYTALYAKTWPNFRANAVGPRSTKSGFMGGFGMQEIAEGVISIALMAQVGSDGPTSRFFDRDGVMGWQSPPQFRRNRSPHPNTPIPRWASGSQPANDCRSHIQCGCSGHLCYEGHYYVELLHREAP